MREMHPQRTHQANSTVCDACKTDIHCCCYYYWLHEHLLKILFLLYIFILLYILQKHLHNRWPLMHVRMSYQFYHLHCVVHSSIACLMWCLQLMTISSKQQSGNGCPFCYLFDSCYLTWVRATKTIEKMIILIIHVCNSHLLAFKMAGTVLFKDEHVGYLRYH